MQAERGKTAVIAGLGLAGWVISWLLFARWLDANDWAFFQGWVAAFTANDFANGLLLDLVVTSLMMIALAVADRRRLGAGWAAAVVGCLAISVTMSLATYLIGIGRAERRAVAAPE